MTAASSTDLDSVHMRRALSLALGGWGQTAPNPMVGAVVVDGHETIGEGFHARYGDAHAEVVALRAGGDRARGATLYVTLEPCAHHGKTPPCVDAIIAAGIRRVVAAVRDPSRVARGGAERLRAAEIQVDVGVEREAACELNAAFFSAHVRERPWVTLKLAVSADGAIADPSGTHRWITGSESRREVHRLRANADAIAVGVGTVLADDPMLTVRDAPPPRVTPRRIVFDSTLRTPLDAALVRTANQVHTTVIATTEELPADKLASLRERDVRVLRHSSLVDALTALRREGVRSLFVEAGPKLAGSLLAASLVDRLVIFRSQLRLGAEAPRAFAFAPDGFEKSLETRAVVEQRQFGDDVMTTFALQDVPCSPD